jgi:predicted metal-dependent HD superfamily phosphohydrolase
MKITDVETLKSNWDTLLQPFLVDSNLKQKVFFDLVTAYFGADRFYHTLEHIGQLIETIEQMKSLSFDFSSVQLAAWFHDVIYDPKANDNEEKSVEYAESALNLLKLPKPTIEHVKNLILTTKSHQASPADIDSQILLDADLAILGSDKQDYQTYAQSIRQEYAWMSDVDYRLGRKQVLQSFLQRPRIYLTDFLFAKLEEKARHNLRWEIAALSLHLLQKSN